MLRTETDNAAAADAPADSVPPNLLPFPAPAPAAAVPDGYMRDAQGRLVPAALVKPEHLLEDALVRELHARAVKLSGMLSEFRAAAMAEIDSLQEVLAEKYNTQRGGQRGNLTMTSFDGMLRLQLAVGDQIELGPELMAAKEIIDTCIRAWSKDAGPELQAVVNDAFDVDKKGQLNTERILGLRRLDIKDPTWLKAMDAIGDAVRVVSSRRYLRFYSRSAPGEKLLQVPLDIARV